MSSLSLLGMSVLARRLEVSGSYPKRQRCAGGCGADSGVEAVQAAHWRAIQLLAGLAARSKPPGLNLTIAADSGLHALHWLDNSLDKVCTPRFPSPPFMKPDRSRDAQCQGYVPRELGALYARRFVMCDCLTAEPPIFMPKMMHES